MSLLLFHLSLPLLSFLCLSSTLLLPPTFTFSLLILFRPPSHSPLLFPLSSFILWWPLHSSACVPSFIHCSWKWNTTPSTVSPCMVHHSHTYAVPPALIHHSCPLCISCLLSSHSDTHVFTVFESILVIWVLSSTWGVIIQSEISSGSFPFRHLVWNLSLFYTVLSRSSGPDITYSIIWYFFDYVGHFYCSGTSSLPLGEI